ncbi:YiiD C-terminal domain-containing protein [Rubinisphaera italica]|uniref:Putative thioesterase n=1 Tax=Rubinisphaera italica TaxID=2527969 RepID=A0A5C5XBY8_9PLAN|nr:YiiD C-terminal domain-containing protein [Rubinisphaera italica]TWT60274.1 putative thioesterase [Rubinisphaera italica]
MSKLNPEQWTEYLHNNIPVCKAMGIEVLEATWEGARILLPLGENVNHRETAFGGSISTAGILACWLLINLRMRELQESPKIVVQTSETTFLTPIADAFEAECRTEDDAQWDRFLKIYQKKGRGRLQLTSTIFCGEKIAAQHSGSFVSIK